ncbi:hypothetical protein OH76DRAFT_1451248 [Lentinus brumalis]|uniref:Uncharacterized protein n=1 Tax=Lentinus brumalis TaxID=2498619 RepID=A0A371DXF5_9APHY|nr:hypothetical protein OH76DRAFT_1451248 [Polyporus brumalis]
MFYSRPSFVPHTKKMAVGLPAKHLLNRIYPSWLSSSQSTDDPDSRQQMEHARHLAKYVFPRQYGLENAFSSSSGPSYGPFRFPAYMDREQEIKNFGSCKTPKRLKHVLDMLEKLIWRHRKCRYQLLLDLACPSKVT